jgi:hypothetical protein
MKQHAATSGTGPYRGRRIHVWLAVLAIFAVCMSVASFFAVWVFTAAGSSKGSPALAAEWRQELSAYQTPAEGKAADNSMFVLRFTTDEWVFGRAQSSHGIWRRGGGTVVIKDSKGNVRTFFGHVCGSGHLPSFSKLFSLSEFYQELAREGFREFPKPMNPKNDGTLDN